METLHFLQKTFLPVGAKRFRVVNKKLSPPIVSTHETGIENEFVAVNIDPETGAIASILRKDNGEELVDSTSGHALNQYLYVPGKDPSLAVEAKTISIVKVEGPLIVSLQITSTAPGAENLLQEIQLMKGINRVDLVNTIDKSKVRDKKR
jgi:hypothetical protein